MATPSDFDLTGVKDLIAPVGKAMTALTEYLGDHPPTGSEIGAALVRLNASLKGLDEALERLEARRSPRPALSLVRSDA